MATSAPRSCPIPDPDPLPLPLPAEIRIPEKTPEADPLATSGISDCKIRNEILRVLMSTVSSNVRISNSDVRLRVYESSTGPTTSA